VRKVLGLTALVLAVALGAESGARLDDRLFEQIPLTANPSSDDLSTRDQLGRHGTPYARFKKWHLDNLGFRGPDVAPQATRGVPRILILGASETFGLYESPEGEFPALLRAANPHLEIINTAIVGMSLPSMTLYWQHLLSALKPDEVLIYPSPLFYLADEPPEAQAGARRAGPMKSGWAFRSRFLDRLRGTLHKPDFVQVRLDQRAVATQLATATPFATVPIERLDAYQHDLEQLVEMIQSSGTTVILMTHAIRFRGDEPDLNKRFAVWEERVYTPRADGQMLVTFNTAANERLRAVARAHGVRVIDVAAAVSGCDACFGDLVHFADLGAQKVAAAVQPALSGAAPARATD
jgi:hypothetical protein